MPLRFALRSVVRTARLSLAVILTVALGVAALTPTFGIVHGGALVGVVGYLPIDRVNRCGEIGYWLAEGAQGRGVMTQCCRFVVRYGFLTLDLNRIQIAAGTENRDSRAIPERLGFQFEGVLRGRENLYGTFIDHAMYSLLRSDFDAAEA